MIAQSNLKVFLALFLVIVIDAMGIGIVFPVLSPLVLNQSSSLIDPQTTLSIREMLYGALIGIFSLFLLLGAPLLGEISDGSGRRKALLICLAGTALSFFLCAVGIWINSLWLLFAGRAINGFTAGSCSIAQAVIADMSTPEHKAKNLSLITLANCFGFVLGPIFGGYFADNPLIESAGYATPFIMAGLLALLNILFMLCFVHDNNQIKRKVHLQLSRGIRIFADSIRLPHVRKISLLFLSMQLAWSMYFQFISILLVQNHHYSPTGIGIFMTFIGILFGICLAFIIRIILRFTTLEVSVRIAFLILAASLGLSALAETEIHQWLITIPVTLSVSTLYTGCLTLFSNAVDKTQQGWVMGVSAAVAAVAWTVGAALAGLLGEWSIGAPFIAAAVFAIIGGIISLKIKENIQGH